MIKIRQKSPLVKANSKSKKDETSQNKYHISKDILKVILEITPQYKFDQYQKGRQLKIIFFGVNYTVHYEGETKDGKPEGKGQMRFKNKFFLIGNFRNGFAEGQCLFFMKKGYYIGNITNNQLNGQGTFKHYKDNCHQYKGSWFNNLPHGRGRQKFTNGDTYSGNYIKGIKQGEDCIYEWENHSLYLRYVGNFRNNYFSGQGTLQKRDLSIISGFFEGQYIKNAKIKSTQSQFQGQLFNGKLHGYGKIVLNNNNVYEGDFYHGLIHGKGTLEIKNGEKLTGTWIQGQYIKSYKNWRESIIILLLKQAKSVLSECEYFQDFIENLQERLLANQQLCEIRVKQVTQQISFRIQQGILRCQRYCIIKIDSYLVSFISQI